MVNTRENKSKGLVKSKGERVAFYLFFSFKKKSIFCKGSSFFYLDSVVELTEIPARPKYTLIIMEGVVIGGLKPMTLTEG